MNKLAYGLLLSLLVSFSSAFAEVSPESLVDIFQRIENLEKKTRELHGENEVLKHQLEQLKKTQKEGFLNIDERMDKIANTVKSGQEPAEEKTPPESDKKEEPTVKIIENKPASPTATDEKKPQQQTSSTETVTPKAESPEAQAPKKIRAPSSYEKETYQAAFNQMKKSPTAATRAFQEYIKMQPDSPLAANAQYWIGEIMYSHNNYKRAVQEFIKVLQKYNYSYQAPDAAIKLGYSFYALKNWAFARRTFEDVLRYFPSNQNAVNLATKRLETMKAAGH